MSQPQPVELDTPYGYVPTGWICAMFVGLFGASTLLHLGQSIYFKLWWLLPTAVLAGVGEVIGWSGRYWSSRNPMAENPFLMQITTTIIAPTPLVAANFIILGEIIRRLGAHFSRLTPRAYTIVFLTADLVALVVQAVGGAMASMADDLEGANRGGRIMLGGIVVQMAAITIYVFLAAEFLIRFNRNRPVRSPQSGTESPIENLKPVAIDPKLKLMIVGLIISTLFIFIRAVYRTIELVDGWNGRIISTQLYFNVLDGMPIVVAMYTLNLFHPGWLVYTRRNTSEEKYGFEQTRRV